MVSCDSCRGRISFASYRAAASAGQHWELSICLSTKSFLCFEALLPTLGSDFGAASCIYFRWMLI